MPPNHGYVFALDEKEKAILMQTALLRFFRRNVLGNKIDLPGAGVKKMTSSPSMGIRT